MASLNLVTENQLQLKSLKFAISSVAVQRLDTQPSSHKEHDLQTDPNPCYSD